MNKAFAAMLARAEADPQQGLPTPLIDAAIVIVNDNALSYRDKRQQIEALAQQANGREQELFGEVWESLIAATPIAERIAADGDLE
ncbi:hypothetical protein [Shewanella sp. KCT]|uniref:hypothetical protein n=1 Tax=Shewanella sp. KCT TaxID=2569535 RepID=UPI0011842511|nr:hypothetical protein [Shewanella sp. KCT]